MGHKAFSLGCQEESKNNVVYVAVSCLEYKAVWGAEHLPA